MATTPAFIGAARIGVAALSAANTNIDGTGVITPLLTGAASGTRVLEIDAKCAATSAAGLVNVFLSADSGATWVLVDSITIAAVTVSTTVASARATAAYQNLVLPDASHRLGVTTTVAQAIKVLALGGDL